MFICLCYKFGQFFLIVIWKTDDKSELAIGVVVQIEFTAERFGIAMRDGFQLKRTQFLLLWSACVSVYVSDRILNKTFYNTYIADHINWCFISRLFHLHIRRVCVAYKHAPCIENNGNKMQNQSMHGKELESVPMEHREKVTGIWSFH